jgi:hypothetical protein
MGMVSFMSQTLYPLGKRPWYPWIGGWGKPGAGLDIVEKTKKSLALPGIEPLFLGCPAHGLSAILTE